MNPNDVWIGEWGLGAFVCVSILGVLALLAVFGVPLWILAFRDWKANSTANVDVNVNCSTSGVFTMNFYAPIFNGKRVSRNDPTQRKLFFEERKKQKKLGASVASNMSDTKVRWSKSGSSVILQFPNINISDTLVLCGGWIVSDTIYPDNLLVDYNDQVWGTVTSIARGYSDACGSYFSADIVTVEDTFFTEFYWDCCPLTSKSVVSDPLLGYFTPSMTLSYLTQ
jgi:hypothetical protein